MNVRELPVDVKALRESVVWSRNKLQPFREHRLKFLREFVGHHYSDDGAPDRVPLNVIELARTIYKRHLVANLPQVLCSTTHAVARVAADDFEKVINEQLKYHRVGILQDELLDDALFGLGICRVDWVYDRDVDIEGEQVPVGRLDVSRIGADDWVHDMRSRSLREACWMGHRHLRPLEEAKSDPSYDEEIRSMLRATHNSTYNERGDERADSLSRGWGDGLDLRSEYEPKVEVWEIYVRRHNLILTFADMGTADEVLWDQPPLKVRPWTGPTRLTYQVGGPYLAMYFDSVPGNSMPLPPASVWFDLHELQNALYRKLARQAERQKTNVAYQPGGSDDAKRWADAGDGEGFETEDPDKIREVRLGGPDQVNLAFLLSNGEHVNRHTGNLDLLGGLAPQSDTASQDKMLSDNASARVGAMRDRTYGFMTSLVEAMAHWIYADPWREYRFIKTVPGIDMIEVEDVNTPEQRQAIDFAMLNFTLVPYSMQPKGPQERLMFVRQALQEFLGPLMPMLQQQGAVIDVQALVRIMSKYGDCPELHELIKFTDIDDISLRGGPVGEMPKPAFSRRIEERVSRPGVTRGGKEGLLAGALMGGTPSAAQAAGMVRPVG